MDLTLHGRRWKQRVSADLESFPLLKNRQHLLAARVLKMIANNIPLIAALDVLVVQKDCLPAALLLTIV